MLLALLLAVAAIGCFDYVTGPEISYGIFYLAPVLIAAWCLGRGGGIAISVAGALAWLLADLNWATVYPYTIARYWNAVVLLGFYLTSALILASLRHALQRQRELARSDFLTGVDNNRAFHEKAEMEKNRARRYHHPLTIAYLDIDNFKVVNDTLGHAAGDELLMRTARILRENLRDTDHVARIGGDEFALLLPETSQSAAAVVLGKVHQVLRRLGSDFPRPVTFSIGAVTFVAEPHSLEQMIGEADRLMYSAKNRGKDQVAHKVVSTQDSLSA